MRFRRDYTKANFSLSFTAWGWAQRMTAFFLALASVIGWVGVLFGWWRADAVGGRLSAATSIFLALWFVWLFVIDTPARIWRDAQPRPFDLEFQEPHTPLAGWTGKHNVYWRVVNHGTTAMCRATLEATDGERDSITAIPLGWVNYEEDRISLTTGEPYEINIGGLDLDSEGFVLKPRRPGSTEAKFHQPIRPPSNTTRLALRIVVRNLDSGESRSHGLVLSLDDEGNPQARPDDTVLA